MKKKRKYHNCKVCKVQGILYTTYHLQKHLLQQHDISLNKYFEIYYNIPNKYDYILDIEIFWTIIKELRRNKVVAYVDCIEHFKTILEQVNHNAARLNIRLNNYAYQIFSYFGIILGNKTQRRKKNELNSMNIKHIDKGGRYESNETCQCHICHKDIRITRLLWHVSTKHHIQPIQYLEQYYNLPKDINMTFITMPLVNNMVDEMAKYNDKFNDYKQLYSYILNKYSGDYRQLVIDYNYDIIKICRALGILNKEYTRLATSYKRLHGIRFGFRNDLQQAFRSSWEANVARILKLENIEYQYEQHKFTVDLNGIQKTYIPDFYVGNNVFFEVKGQWKRYGKQKVEAFKEQYPQYMLCVIDKYIYLYLKQQYSHKIPNWED